jgi:hypothetical protein
MKTVVNVCKTYWKVAQGEVAGAVEDKISVGALGEAAAERAKDSGGTEQNIIY